MRSDNMNLLLSFWLELTGGASGCRRRRFALSMLIAYGLHHLLLPGVIECGIMLRQHGISGEFSLPGNVGLFIGILMSIISLLLSYLPLSPLALLGGERALMEAYEAAQGAAVPATAAPEALWPYWLGFLFGSLALLAAGSVAFGAAWRRLRDAGRSPFYLLLGLTYLLGIDTSGAYAAESAGIFLLGPLWLIILYSQPGKKRTDFALFRNPDELKS